MKVINNKQKKVNIQVYNPSTGNYIKRDSTTGKFEVKPDGTPFKGIRKRRSLVKSNPHISKTTAKKAEKAVIIVRNKMAVSAK
jgi:hypothetical protein